MRAPIRSRIRRRESGATAGVSHFGLRLYDDRLTLAQTTALAQRAEARGYETVWVPESAGKEAFSQLTAYALETRRFRVATSGREVAVYA
jgi:alkanesulfonate monooxygenase SsuD/methylene tetrahydromethanopterin reductase-like flavin-dependent oxidoreductase (luciferase family)